MTERPSFMDMALAEAEAAALRGEVPVGAVIVDGDAGTVLARAGNRCEEKGDPTAHAELIAIRAALHALGENARGRALSGCDLYVTLEPCPMCAQAVALVHLRRLYYGAPDPKGGGVEAGPRIFDQPTCHHRPEIYPGIGDKRAGALLRAFFRARR
jgi:tRNA(adenine34) deaminase